MEDSFNTDPNLSKAPKTSSTDGKDSEKTTGDSEVQNGVGIANHEENRAYDKSEDQQEYIEQANNNTAAGNESPVQDGKGMTMRANSFADGNDEDDEDDDNDPSSTEITIGDDPEETERKLPVM